MFAAIRIWLTIFVCWPAPAGPAARSSCPAARAAAARARARAASPPTMIESVAARAPTSPPETGASSALDAARARRRVDLARQARLAGRHVDQHRARPRGARARPSRSEHDLAHVGGEADDREDHVGIARQPPRARRPSARRARAGLRPSRACACTRAPDGPRRAGGRTSRRPSRRCRSSRRARASRHSRV